MAIADAGDGGRQRDRSRTPRGSQGKGKGKGGKGKQQDKGPPAKIECGGGMGPTVPEWLRWHYRNCLNTRYICFDYKNGRCTKKGDHDGVVHACNHDQCRQVHSLLDCPRRT